MHIHVKTIKKELFKPFTVTLTINTYKEALDFHGKVLRELGGTKASPAFGAVYKALHGDSVDAEDEI